MAARVSDLKGGNQKVREALRKAERTTQTELDPDMADLVNTLYDAFVAAHESDPTAFSLTVVVVGPKDEVDRGKLAHRVQRLSNERLDQAVELVNPRIQARVMNKATGVTKQERFFGRNRQRVMEDYAQVTAYVKGRRFLFVRDSENFTTPDRTRRQRRH